MKLSRIDLTNFRCFESLSVSLNPDVNVLVGNNGAGKTAILEGVACALSRILSRFPHIKGKTFSLGPDDIRIGARGTQAPFVRVEVHAGHGPRWTRTVKRDQTRQTAADVPDAIGDKALFEFLDPAIHAIAEGGEATLPVFAYYGVGRAVLDIPERRRNFRKEFRRFDALDNALNPATRFKDLFEWFYAQERDEMEGMLRVLDDPRLPDFQKVTPPRLPVPEWLAGYLKPLPVLAAVRDAIAVIVPGFTRPRIQTNPLRMVLTQRADDKTERELSLQMLSDGYRTMIALVMDFARRMAQANPHLDKPLEAEAILMVDEIDLHLHPVWQQTVIPSFRRAFPNAQLIVSTHSPQVLTTVEREKILIVEPGGVRPCPAPTYGASSADVVSEVLGLASLRPPGNEIAGKIASLFAAIDDGDLNAARVVRGELDAWAKGFPEPDLVRADLMIRRLEAKAAAKLPVHP